MYEKMTRTELVAELVKRDAELLTLKSAKELGRKAQVMNLITERGRVTIAEIAEATGMTARNVSTQLTYLRADGNCFGKDSKGRLYIEADVEADVKADVEADVKADVEAEDK